MPGSTHHHPPGTTASPAGRPLRLLLVGHGYPPQQSAGTEQHMAQLTAGLTARGHQVTVLAATRDPARRQYELLEEVDPVGVTVHRLVQNMPTRALARAERDRAVEAAAGAIAQRLRPDLVHIHHVQFLSSGLRFEAPVVLTLHDQWLWCAAGGLGIVAPGGQICPGPAPGRCSPCAAAWSPAPGRAAQAALATAGRLSGLVAPDRLHHLFRGLPAGLRQRVQAPARGRPIEEPAAAAARNAALIELGRQAALRLSPSRHLADLAEEMGLGPVEHLPHGVDAPAHRPAPAARRGALLFLGTVAAHKGPGLVVSAWRRAFPEGRPGLDLHGPVADPALALGHPLGGPLDRAQVAAKLASARALVIGSIWPENAPLVALEARAAGCPVIAPAIGGLPELVVPGRDGWLYPAGDQAALAQAMRQAVEAPLPHPPRLPPSVDDQVEILVAAYRRVLWGR